MVEEISRNLYRIEIPLSGNPLRAINSYVIKGPERNLIIDTGWNQKECLDAMEGALSDLGVDKGKTDFFITHLHSDHLGLVSSLAAETSKIYFNQPEADRILSGISWEVFAESARMNGFPEMELQAVTHIHPGFKFRSQGQLSFRILKEGDTLAVSDYLFRCVETPGHSKGHLCLYEPGKKIFVAGDHILNDITPNIQLWSDDWNPLKEYLESLEKVSRLDIDLVLPGHRGVFRSCRRRIEELKDHHRRRLEETVSILKGRRMNAFQVASRMSWDLLYDSWDLFPVSQKWFATGEAISHLKYLEEKGGLRRELEGKVILFSLAGPNHSGNAFLSES
jgi:glyoxylase-like metal-dependent hydrolase (beta-lactamase superfamily II)